MYQPDRAPQYDSALTERLIATTIEMLPPPKPEPKTEVPPPIKEEVERIRPVKRLAKRKPVPKKIHRKTKPEPAVPKVVAKNEMPPVKNRVRRTRVRRPAKRTKKRVAVVSKKASKVSLEDASAGQAAKTKAQVAKSTQSAKKTQTRREVRTLERTYYGTLSSYLRRNYRYPRRARIARLEGTVLVELVIDANGKILRRRIVRSSGWEILDDAALSAMAQLSTVPAPPSNLPWSRRAVRVPLRYQLST